MLCTISKTIIVSEQIVFVIDNDSKSILRKYITYLFMNSPIGPPLLRSPMNSVSVKHNDY